MNTAEPGDALAIRVALRQQVRLAPVPVCLFDEGDTVYFGKTAYEVLWTYDNGDKLLRHSTAKDLVRFSPGIAVSLVRPVKAKSSTEALRCDQ